MDYFYLDLKNKNIKSYSEEKDSFVDGLQGIKKIEVVKSEEKNVNREIRIYLQGVEEPVTIGIDKNNQIVKYENKNITKIGDNFLYANRGITYLELPNLTQVGGFF